MKTHNLIKISVLIGCIWCTGVTLAQEDCSQKLKMAESSFDGGNIEDVESHLSQCLLNEGFTTAEREEAYKLLVKVGLFEDDFSKAEKNMIALLKTNPDFIPKASDPIELKNLYALFRTDPVMTVGINAGLNVGYATTFRYYSVENSATAQSYTSSGVGFQTALEYNYRLAGGFYASVAPMYASTGFKDWGTNMYNGTQTLSYKEKISTAGLNIGVINEFRRTRKFKPTLKAGVGYYSILTSKTKVTRDYNDESGSASIQETEVDLTTSAIRNRATGMFTGEYGVDFKFKAGRGHFLLGISHQIGLTNITQYKYNNELMYKYYMILDDMTMNMVMFKLGYLQSIYNPKILKRKLKKNEK